MEYAMSTRTIIKLFSLCVVFMTPCWGGRQSIKVVEEPTNFGMNFGGGGGGYNDQAAGPSENTLKMRVPPSNFSGPPHLKVLQGKCYTLVTEEYKYELCPFSNVTQHEQSLRWNPYSGILGVWQEWEIENNTFVAMVMREGDNCGSTPRTVRIFLKCGNKTHVASVSEPSKCQYEMELLTPLVCHPHSLLVYPTLSAEWRHQWDLLETQYQQQEITFQGYRKFLRQQVFEPSGLCLAEQQRMALAEEAKHVDEVKAKHEQGEFETLDQCTDELKRLKEKVKRYQDMLEQNGINPDNGKKNDYMDMDSVEQDGQADYYGHHGDYYDYAHDMDL